MNEREKQEELEKREKEMHFALWELSNTTAVNIDSCTNWGGTQIDVWALYISITGRKRSVSLAACMAFALLNVSQL